MKSQAKLRLIRTIVPMLHAWSQPVKGSTHWTDSHECNCLILSASF